MCQATRPQQAAVILRDHEMVIGKGDTEHKQLLDRLDPDPDLEPSLGSLEQRHHNDSQESWAGGASDDREFNDSDLEDGADTEPWLGWTVDGHWSNTESFSLFREV